MPILPQDAPFAVTPLWESFQTDLDASLARYEGRRFEVTGIAVAVGPDIHHKPSIALSDRVNGPTYALTVFPNKDHHNQVAAGDRVTVRGNYLVLSNQFGVVMKYSELVRVEKSHAWATLSQAILKKCCCHSGA